MYPTDALHLFNVLFAEVFVLVQVPSLKNQDKITIHNAVVLSRFDAKGDQSVDLESPYQSTFLEKYMTNARTMNNPILPMSNA